MRRAALAALALLLALPAGAQDAAPDGVPDRRVAISRDVDFYGSDLVPLLDTTLDACQAACLADAACAAFTYNQRSASCFPKSGVAEVRPFAGGVSGRVLGTDPAVLAEAPARAAELAFLDPADLDAAERLGREVGREHSSDEQAAADLLAGAAAAEAAGDPLSALAFAGAALALTDDAGGWRDYARLALLAPSDGGDAAAAARARAVPAAVAAYLRGPDDGARGAALLLLAQGLEAQGRTRETVPALRLAARLLPTPEAVAALDRAVALWGFNVAETQVDSDAALPRVCVLFNEPLRPGFDYAPYVRLPDPALTVTAEDAQLCVEGAAHGERVAFALREGLPAASGESLARPVDLALYVRDRAPAARVLSRAYVLPRGGAATLPVETVNLAAVDLTISRVSDRNLVRALSEGSFAQPLYGWDRTWFAQTLGAPVWEGAVEVPDAPLNQDVVTEVPLAEALGGEPAGVYVLTAAVPREEAGADPDARPATSQWFVLTDLGLATYQGEDGLTVVVRSLADAGAVEGATVTLVARDNAVLGTAATDARGVARFEAGLTRGTSGAAPALVTATTGPAEAPTDLAFLSLTDPAFDLSDRGVEGREAAGPLDAFLALDRGAYRAGETVHATALLRGSQAEALPDVPLTAVLSRPDGVESAREVSAPGAAGGHVFAFPPAPNAPRGAWRLAVWADPEAAAPLAEASLLVEDFLPERIDLALSAAGGATLGGAVPVEVDARYLFGAPAADLAVEGEVTLAPRAELPGWPGYRFGPHDAPFGARTEGFAGLRTGADGRARLDLPLPALDLPAAEPLEARVALRVLESSNRPVERQLTVPVAPSGPLLGLKVPAEPVAEGSRVELSVLSLGPDLGPAPAAVRWTVSRIDTRYQWYEVDGQWSWEPQTRRVRVAEGEVALTDGPATFAVPVEWGAYEVTAERTDGAALASATFAAGWSGAGEAEEAPDRLAVSLDRPAYAPGDTATLRIDAEGPGTALVTVLTNQVVAMEVVEVGADGASVTLPVTDEWGAGAYVAAEMLRPLEGRAPGQAREPARSLGLAHAGVEPGDRLLAVSLDAPDAARPRGPLTVGVEVAGLAAGEGAYVTLAAVDVGILNLTGFEAPDPTAHYFGQRRLGVELRDLYGRLIEPTAGAAGTLREGGDALSLAVQSPPPTEALLAFFAGPVAVDATGRAEATFDLPAFNGTVRLMAVAWSAKGVGSASRDVIVRDPVVLQASLPRALSPGDRSRIRLDLTHAEGPAGAVPVEVSAPGLDLALPPGGLVADLAAGGTWAADVGVTAPVAGDFAVTVALTAPGGERLDRALTIPVAPKDPAVARTARFELNPGEAFTFDDSVLAGFAPGTAEATLSVGPLARLDAAGLLRQLDAVPWGCTEQVASQTLPLLYLSSVAEAAGIGTPADLDARIEGAVALILGNQASNGAFGLWGAYGGDLWLDAYVTDVLSRARATGHAVPEEGWRLAIDNLRNQVASYPDFEAGGEDLAYALLVLAREGEALVGDLRYYADAKAEAFGTPLALAQLGAALAAYGDPARADRLFAAADARLGATAEDPTRSVWRIDYGTERRDAAAVLALAAEAGSDAVDRDALAASLGARVAEPASTQEAAWTLLAAAALAGDLRATGVTVDGAAPAGPTVLRVGDGSAAQVVRNDGTAPVDLTVTALGVPEGEVGAGGQGYAIERAYWTLDGAPADPAEVAQGTRLVAVLTVTPLGYQAGRLMVTDPLPGGFEIDNPNLLSGGDVGDLAWLRPAPAAHTEARADRFLAAVDWQGEEAFQVAYVLRAATPGDYRHPAASVEDMYRPALRAQTAGGRVVVTE